MRKITIIKILVGAIAFIILMLLPSILASGKEMNGNASDVSCINCHPDEAKEFQKSVHYDTILCTDCHGGNITINQTISMDSMHDNFKGVPMKIDMIEICSNCHNNVTKEYKQSTHWNALEEKGVASCTDCHGTHNIISYKDPNSMTYFENVPLLCSNCHENQTKMQAWYYGIKTDRFDTYKKSYHYKAMILGGGKEKSLATCPDCHENHNTKNESDPESAIYPANLVKTCEKSGCHTEQKSLIYGGKVHEGRSVYILSTNIDLKRLITYFYIVMIMFELTFTLGLIFLGTYSKVEIRKRDNNSQHNSREKF